MKRLLLLSAVAAAAAGCVSVEGLPDPHGTLKPGQRIVVAVYPSPGPWIVGSTDSKAASAAKITPLGFLIQTVQDQSTLSVSKDLQQYLPRPRLALAAQETLMSALRAARSTDTVQTAPQAGIDNAQLAEWNKSKDQLDWRSRYYAPDPDQPPPRDYARLLSLDDALILDVNISFGTDANDAGFLMPEMTASSRVYRGDTSRLLWQHEDVVAQQASSATLTDYRVAPWTLTDSLTILAPALGTAVANSFLQAFTVLPSTTGVHLSTSSASGGGTGHVATGGGGGGLVPMSAFDNLSSSTSTPAGLAPPTAPAAPALPPLAVVAGSTGTASGVAGSTAAAPSPSPPGASPTAPPILSTAAASVPISTPAVSVSTPAVSVSTPAAAAAPSAAP
jgi:hypothetical protein